MYRPVVVCTVAVALASSMMSSGCSRGEAYASAKPPASSSDVSGTTAPATTNNGSAMAAPSSADAALPGVASRAPAPLRQPRVPNELGRIPVLEYHLIEQREWRWGRNWDRFRRDLKTLYDRGYRPVTMVQVLDKKIDLPRGVSPVVFVFDDASPGQFSYIRRNGKLDIDPHSAVGIWLDFNKTHRDWTPSAVFCVLPAAAAGHAFFGDKGIDGQETAWRFPKLQFLAQHGFEICNHTLWHANLGKYSDAFVQEQIARGQLAIDSAVPGYIVRTFALPLGVWPRNKPLAWQGSWTNPKNGKITRYHYDAVLEVAGGSTRSPYDPKFDPHHVNRVELFGTALEHTLDALDKSGTNGRYVSDGDPKVVARPR